MRVGKRHSCLYYSLYSIHYVFYHRNNSNCADIYVDALRGTATVMYKNDNKIYRYFNVSRRACMNFVNNPNMSVGFWINANLFQLA